MEVIGLIAGNGSFPLLFAREARARGYRVAAVAHRGETDAALSGEVDSLTWVRVGQLGKLVRALKREGVERAVMAGGINKSRSLAALRPDWRGLWLLSRLALRGDDAILRRLATELERAGIHIVPSTLLLNHIIVRPGLIAGPAPARQALSDVRLGCRVLAGLGALDIGQGVVVEEGVILAVEAIEGTDEAIRRAGRFGRGRAVVVKTAKPGQDLRFDVPAVGPETIRSMMAAGATTLAIEAGKAIILEGENLVALATEAGISVLGCTANGSIVDV